MLRVRSALELITSTRRRFPCWSWRCAKRSFCADAFSTDVKRQNFYATSGPEFDAALVHDLGQPKFRAQQVRDWVYTKGVQDFQQMANLPKQLRQELTDRYTFGSLTLAAEQVSVLSICGSS